MYNDFINNVVKDDYIKYLLSKLKSSLWKKIEEKEKINVLKEIVSRFNLYYPELGKCFFDFVMLDGANFEGENIDNYNIINVANFSNQFEILSSCIHELRHFYQNSACDFFDLGNGVHKLFEDEKEFERIYDNTQVSPLGGASNYIHYSPNAYIEYYIQPMEKDAEKFACDFMKAIAKEILDDPQDVKMCLKTCEEYDRVMGIVNGDNVNIINFGKIYELNIDDYYNKNKKIFERENAIYEEYLKKFNDIESLNDKDILGLISCYFWNKFSVDVKEKIMKRYLDINDCKFNFIIYNDKVIVNNREVEINDSIKIMEIIFDEMANQKIRDIVNKKGNLSKAENEIRLNLNGNIIKENENPLFYNIQPYILYKNYFILNKFYMLFNCIDETLGVNYSLFDEYSKYIKKYDVETMKKKVELLTGKNFKEIYDDLVKNMRDRRAR